jgi:hypothetical protein
MSTIQATLRRWFDKGVQKKATHMIVACDTFDHGDFPVYVMPGQDVRTIAKEHDESRMLRLMEVYDLSADRESQLEARRVFNYGDSKSSSAKAMSEKEVSLVGGIFSYMRKHGHKKFTRTMAKDACSWMAERQVCAWDAEKNFPVSSDRSSSSDDGIVDVLTASEQLVACVRMFAARVVECQKKKTRPTIDEVQVQDLVLARPGDSSLAEKLWENFRSLSLYPRARCTEAICRKPFSQLGVSIQNLWSSLAHLAASEVLGRIKTKDCP